jgi:hypothetical protein
LNRKKKSSPIASAFAGTLELLRHPVKFYHLGLTALFICVGICYFSGGAYDHVKGTSLIDGQAGLSITNNTISVNSSTMLTSIPTMMIR